MHDSAAQIKDLTAMEQNHPALLHPCQDCTTTRRSEQADSPFLIFKFITTLRSAIYYYSVLST